MKFYLIVAKGTKKGMPIPIAVDLFLIGSDRMCQLRKDTLGPKHCALITREDKVYICDMHSDQPTLVNNVAIHAGQEWPLHAGDRIEIGPLEFMIQYREKPLSRRDLEEWASGCLDENRAIEEDDYNLKTTASAAAQSIIDVLQAQKGLIKGRLRVGLDKGINVVRLNDENVVADAEIQLIRHELCAQLDKPNIRVLIDLKNVRRLSSNGVRMLIEFNRWLRSRGGKLAFTRVPRDLSQILDSFQMEKIPYFPDKNVALTANW